VVAEITSILKETRSEILKCIKASGRMSVGEIAEAVGVSRVCARRHLDLLSRGGLVGYEVVKADRGRPGFVYYLSEKASLLYPTSYDSFALGLLKNVRDLFGADAVSRLISSHCNDNINLLKSELEGLGFKEKVKRLSSLLNDRGYATSVRRLRDGSFLIEQHNCPMVALATIYEQFCNEELRLYRELLGVEVVRECRIAAGARSCNYRVFPESTARPSIIQLSRASSNTQGREA
jgi:predicted ArsR family transcriptional regulator